MSRTRLCDFCDEELTDERATYDLDGRYRFKLVVAERVTWWRSRKETQVLDVCGDCVREIGRQSASTKARIPND